MSFIAGYEHFIGGIAGGLASTASCHPFDLMKIRFAANEGSDFRPQYRGYWHATKSIYATNGLPGLYRGLSAAVIAAPISWGLYFHFYHRVRSVLNIAPDYPFIDNLLAGSATGAFILSITNPLWVCKTRMCLQYERHGAVEQRYFGLVNCWRTIMQNDGWRGFYKGYVPGLLGTMNGAIQFAIYNWFKDTRCHQLGLAQDTQLKPFDYLLFSTLSKCLSTVITFPYQLLRTRLQDQHTNYSGTVDCFMRTLRKEGVLGLYKGVLAATVKQLPYSVITYFTYEQTRYFLERLSKERSSA